MIQLFSSQDRHAQERFNILPSSWIATTLGEVFRWGSGGTPRRSTSSFYDGDIPWAIIGDLNDAFIDKTKNTITQLGLEASSAHLVPVGSILLAMYGSIGKLGIAGTELATNQAIAYTQTGQIFNKYLFWYLFACRDMLIALGKGDTQSNISQTVIKAFPFLLAPLPEQHRIVAEIEKQLTGLDASVGALRRARANLKRYRASVLKAACEGKLVPTEAELAQVEGRDYESGTALLERILIERRARWESQERRRGKYKEPAAPDTLGFPELPEGWVWSTSAQIATSMLGKMLDKKRVSGSPLPYLRNLNVRWDSFDLRDILTMPFVESEIDRYALLPGDVLIAEGGEPGRAAVWPGNEQPFKYQKALHRLRLFDGVLPKWLVFQLWASAQTGGLESYFTGSTIKHFTGESLERYPLAVPPLAEQQRIVGEVERRLSVVQQAEDTVDASLKRAVRLRQSILKQAFSGQLLPQDPNDEPASLLLERIRAQREATRTVLANSRKSRRPRSRPSPEGQLLLSEETS